MQLTLALQSQFSQLTEFFVNVASLLNDILKPSIERWTKTMEQTVTLGGVTVGGTVYLTCLSVDIISLREHLRSRSPSDIYADDASAQS
jgi:hypothetical protein